MKKIALIIALLAVVAMAYSQASVAKKPQVMIFISPKCPCVFSHQATFAQLISKYKDRIDFKAVFIDKTCDSYEINDMMNNLKWKINFETDKKGAYIKAYHPKVYTDCVLISSSGAVVYQGAVDDSPLNMGQVLHFYLKDAIEDYLLHKPIKVKEGKGAGCLISI